MGVLQKAKTIKSKCKAAKPVSSTKVVLKKNGKSTQSSPLNSQ